MTSSTYMYMYMHMWLQPLYPMVTVPWLRDHAEQHLVVHHARARERLLGVRHLLYYKGVYL